MEKTVTKETTLFGEGVKILSMIAGLLFFVTAVWSYHTGASLDAIYSMLGAIYCGQKS